jgi:hypothetical protein
VDEKKRTEKIKNQEICPVCNEVLNVENDKTKICKNCDVKWKFNLNTNYFEKEIKNDEEKRKRKEEEEKKRKEEENKRKEEEEKKKKEEIASD